MTGMFEISGWLGQDPQVQVIQLACLQQSFQGPCCSVGSQLGNSASCLKTHGAHDWSSAWAWQPQVSVMKA